MFSRVLSANTAIQSEKPEQTYQYWNSLLSGSDTFVDIQRGELVVTQGYRNVLRLGSYLNDAEWHNFTLAISAHGRVEAFAG